MMDGMGGFGMGFFGWAFMILVWVLIIAGIISLVKWLMQSTSGSQSKKTPLEILQERFARGDIDEGEYERKKNILQG
ncbi:MAG: SHOCT domain-containing protein [Acidiferrobacterales bacterium]